jgi:flagellar motility protein MotE (MotC chaperone)
VQNHQNKSKKKKPKYSADDEHLTLELKYATTSTKSLAKRKEGISTYRYLRADARLARLITVYRKMDDIKG